MTDADNRDDQALLANTPAQAKSLLYRAWSNQQEVWATS